MVPDQFSIKEEQYEDELNKPKLLRKKTVNAIIEERKQDLFD